MSEETLYKIISEGAIHDHVRPLEMLRITSQLSVMGIETMEQLADLKISDLYKIPTLGINSLKKILGWIELYRIAKDAVEGGEE